MMLWRRGARAMGVGARAAWSRNEEWVEWVYA